MFGSTFISEAEKVDGNNIIFYYYIIWLRQEETEEKNVEVNPENQNLI
jgi:hypothetical protein